MMIASNLRIALRRIRRQKLYSLINVAGLAVGLACCIAIVLYVTNELTYDSFHPDADRIYRVAVHQADDVGEFRSVNTPGPLAPALAAGYPEVERAVRIIYPPGNFDNVLVVQGEKRFFEKRVWFADPGIFQVFRIPLLQGDPNALARPSAVFLTEGMARKYFGNEAALGRTLRIEVDYETGTTKLADFEVAGIIRNAPSNTHFKYDMLLSMPTFTANVPKLNENWLSRFSYTYVKLRPGADAARFEGQIQPLSDIFGQKVRERFAPTLKLMKFFLQPVARIHMFSRLPEFDPPGNWTYIAVYSVIALLILLIGVMNFINMSAALATVRTKEIGLRKVVGARRRQIAGQILGESFLITLFAFGLGLLLASVLLLPFNQMAGTDLTLAGLGRLPVILSLLGLLAFVSLGSAFYPALILNSFRPAGVLHGRSSAGSRTSGFQRFLVVGQFAITLLLVISTLTVFRQLRFMKGQALGFDINQKIILKVQSNLGHFRRDTEAIKSDFGRHPSVRGVTVSSVIPGVIRGGGYYLVTRPENYKNAPRLLTLAVDEDFMSQYGIRLAAGRAFEGRNGPDRKEAIIVNEAGAKALGFASAQEALGKSIQDRFRPTKRIVGVTENFHYLGMKELVEPLILDLEPSLYQILTLSIRVDMMNDLMRYIRRTWETHFPGVPFDYSFLDESVGRQYRYEQQMGRLLGIIAALGIGVACLGLLGLSSFIARKREKEIGVRKVLGASPSRIVALLSLEHLKPVLVAVVIAAPLAWYAMDRWLSDFAYRVSLNVWITLIVAAGALAVALGTVGLQGLHAASAKPADTLRNE